MSLNRWRRGGSAKRGGAKEPREPGDQSALGGGSGGSFDQDDRAADAGGSRARGAGRSGRAGDWGRDDPYGFEPRDPDPRFDADRAGAERPLSDRAAGRRGFAERPQAGGLSRGKADRPLRRRASIEVDPLDAEATRRGEAGGWYDHDADPSGADDRAENAPGGGYALAPVGARPSTELEPALAGTELRETPRPDDPGLRFRALAPFGKVERLLAARYLRSRRKESFISVITTLSLIGITLGVATLIIVMSVMNGFREELVEKIVGVSGHLTVASDFGVAFDDYDTMADQISNVPGVTLAAPMIQSPAFVTGPNAGVGAVVRGMTRESLLEIEGVGAPSQGGADFPIGSLDEFVGDNGVAIGAGMARTLGVTVGDTISIISPRGNATPIGYVPKRRAYPVLYVFSAGMYQFDQTLLYMPLEEAQGFFNRVGPEGRPVVDVIEVMVATPDRLDGYKTDIQDALDGAVRIGDWQSANSTFIGALKTERTVMFLILTLLILIASLIIISGMIMLVKEKGADIAILRTMGLGRWAVLRVFFICGATIGAVGTAVGVALGVVVTLNLQSIKAGVESIIGGEVFPDEVYILSELPARLQTEDVALTVGIALGLSFLATLFPAWRAASLDPVEALRYE